MTSIQATAAFTLTLDATTFVWHGGEYIEIGYIATERGSYEIDYGHAVGDFVSQDCINVWDHEHGVPRIARTLEAFQTTCEEWLREQAMAEFGQCEVCGDRADHCQGHAMDETDAVYFAAVAQVAQTMDAPRSEDTIRAAFAMVEPPAYIIADTEPVASEVASVRALLGFQS